MVFYLPVLGAIALASGTILERIILRKRKVDIKLYQTAGFLAIVLAMIPFIYFFWKLDPAALELKNIIIFSIVVLFSIIANLLIFYSLKWEKVSNLQPARVLEPLFVIFLAIIFSFFVSDLYERNFNIIIPALVAAAALIFSHVKRYHLTFNKYFIAAVLGSFFFAVELVVSMLILNFYSPMSFYFLRSSAILLISFIIFRPNFKKLNTKVRWLIFLTGAIWAFYRIIIYYGYLNIGIIFTTLIIMLGPIFIYIFAKIFLKEKLEWRNVVAGLVIAASVIYAIVGN